MRMTEREGAVAPCTEEIPRHFEDRLAKAGHTNAVDRNHYRRLSACCAALVTARQEFGGDLDQAVIYLVLAMSALDLRLHKRTSSGINALSIAEITLIPRETVRRKLRELADLHRVWRGQDGLWRIEGDHQLDFIFCILSDLFEISVNEGMA